MSVEDTARSVFKTVVQQEVTTHGKEEIASGRQEGTWAEEEHEISPDG